MIAKELTLSEVLSKGNLDKELLHIADKIQQQQRLTDEEGVLLLKKHR